MGIYGVPDVDALLLAQRKKDMEEYKRLLLLAQGYEEDQATRPKGATGMGMIDPLAEKNYWDQKSREGAMGRIGDRLRGGTGTLQVRQGRAITQPMSALTRASGSYQPEGGMAPEDDLYQIRRALALETLKRAQLGNEAIDPNFDWERAQRAQVLGSRQQQWEEANARRQQGVAPAPVALSSGQGGQVFGASSGPIEAPWKTAQRASDRDAAMKLEQLLKGTAAKTRFEATDPSALALRTMGMAESLAPVRERGKWDAAGSSAAGSADTDPLAALLAAEGTPVPPRGGAQPAVSPVPPSGSAPPKVATAAQIQQYATENQLDPQAVAAELRRQGYVIR